MSSQYSQSRLCQVRGCELAEVLRLAARVIADVQSSGGSNSSNANGSCSSSVVAGALLSEAHVRALVVGAPARVLIPQRKHGALIAGNPFIQAAAAAAAASAEGKAGGTSTSSNGKPGAASSLSVSLIATDREAHLPSHRVGTIVALLPKPGSTSPSYVSVVAPGDWLLAVNLGEVTELFPLRSVSDEPFTAAEHQAYTQTVMGGAAVNRAGGVTPAAVLLSGAELEGLRRRLVEMRGALLLVLGGNSKSNNSNSDSGGGGDVTDAEIAEQQRRLLTALVTTAAAAATEHGGGEADSRKRARIDVLEEGPSSPAESARLRETIARQAAQLQSLRQLLQKKEGEAVAAVHRHRGAEEQHAAEVGQLRGKAEEEARARERGQREAQQQLAERDGRLQAAGEKLRSVAEMAAKYKRVYDVLVGTALGFTAEEARAKKPEEVIELLRARKNLS